MTDTFDSHVVTEHQQTVDPHVLSVLPDVAEVLEVAFHQESAWAKAFRLNVRQKDGSKEDYFMKVSFDDHGKQALMGEFESTSAIHRIIPEFCPKPIGWGTFKNDTKSHFYICKFYDFIEGVPEPNFFCEQLAQLHSSHSSPEGKFGFHCTTYNGNLPQNNTWCDSWETFFAHGLRHVLKVREERAGHDLELDELMPALFDKIIPRLLRPLESEGRTIRPSLVHGDLWYGNTGIIDADTEKGIVYDPASFWAHNEYELGNWRPERNRFPRRFFKTYHSHIDKAEPKEDYDDRNALYSLRFNLHAAALYPKDKSYVRMAIDEIRRLAEIYPDGYTSEVA
ncbi:Fructosamine kinase domain-containing protein [Trichoderma sp. SZMC 28013]